MSKRIMWGALIALLFFSCRSAYDTVHNDKNVTKNERAKLAGPCSDQFPCLPGKPSSTVTGVDSSEYQAALNAIYQQIDENILQKDSIIKLLAIIQQAQGGALNAEQIEALMRATRERDSTLIIQNFLRWYKPKPVKEYVKDSIPYLDLAQIAEYERKYRACQDHEQVLETAKNTYEAQAKKYRKNFWIATGSGILFILLLIGYLIRRATKKV